MEIVSSYSSAMACLGVSIPRAARSQLWNDGTIAGKEIFSSCSPSNQFMTPQRNLMVRSATLAARGKYI